MERTLDTLATDDNTKLVFGTLIYAINEAIKDKHLADIKMYTPTSSDGFVKNQFERKTNTQIDLVYYICLEDLSDRKNDNFSFIDTMFTAFREFLKEQNITKMDGYDITISGTLFMTNGEHTCYYLVFCLEDNRFIAQA